MAVIVGLLLMGGAVAVVLRPHRAGSAATASIDDPLEAGDDAQASASAAATGVPCGYPPADPGTAAARAVAAPPSRAALGGEVRATLRTTLGDITLALAADAAPCTVNAFVALARADFYSDSACHRLTTDGIWILQCGDPTGTGTGNPGYSYADENLPPPTQQPGYARGTVAMGNSGPDTNGSQFFIVYRDSDLSPDYPVLGRVLDGLDVVDRVAAAGTDSGALDGRPKQEIRIDEVVISPSTSPSGVSATAPGTGPPASETPQPPPSTDPVGPTDAEPTDPVGPTDADSVG